MQFDHELLYLPRMASPAGQKTSPPAAHDVAAAVARVLGDPRVVWFPIKHFSPACAWHVRALIRELRPAAVLVEAPDDATPLIEHLVDPASEPPLTVFSSYTDSKNRYGMNGVMSPDPNVPVRYRSWWPIVAWAPEYVALMAGREVGAALAFIDLPLTARIPFEHARHQRATEVVGDEHLAMSAWFDTLRRRQRRRSFGELWEANFEAGGLRADRERFQRAVLTFAWCARHAGDIEGRLAADGTLAREQHMRWHVDQALKARPEGPVVVVTGAFHSVALPFTKGKRGAGRADPGLTTLLTPHSFRALAELYDLERLPGWQQAVWDAMEAGSEAPFDAAGMRMVVEVMRAVRAQREAVSTADAVGAWQAAQSLARLRGDPEVTVYDVLDAVQMGYVKGDRRLFAAPVEQAARAVLVGRRIGRVSGGAGQVPLLADFYAECKAHRLDVSGEEKVVRLDLHKQEKHRAKSAFLHRCDFLDVPLFGELPETATRAGGHFRGPDLATGEDLHLITETWAVRWSEEVDDRLLELADRGPTVEHAAASRLREKLAGARTHAADATRLLLRCAQMMLADQLDAVLGAVEGAIEADSRFVHLVDALGDFVLLHAHRETLATRGHERLLRTVVRLYEKAALVLPGLAFTDAEEVDEVLDRVQALVRVALTFEAGPPAQGPLDRDLLVEKMRALIAHPDGTATIRGVGLGVLFSFGALRETHISMELLSYLRGTPDRVVQAGQLLDGLFASARGVFMRSPRLLRTVNAVLAELPWAVFKRLLPDLRRAFTRFIPHELDGIAQKVAREIGLEAAPDADAPVPSALVHAVAAADARARAALEGWW